MDVRTERLRSTSLPAVVQATEGPLQGRFKALSWVTAPLGPRLPRGPLARLGAPPDFPVTPWGSSGWGQRQTDEGQKIIQLLIFQVGKTEAQTGQESRKGHRASWPEGHTWHRPRAPDFLVLLLICTQEVLGPVTQ